MRLGLSVDWERRTVCLTEPPDDASPEFHFHWRITHPQLSIEGDDHMVVTMKDTDKVAVAISVVDAKGNPTKVDGAPLWSVSDPEGLALTAAEDGLSCEIAAVGSLGFFQAAVEVDADLGEGVEPLIGILDFEIVAGEAVAVNFSVGAPEPA